ncbi:MAG: chemotaxis protein CheW [Thiohalomonadaceae bacterium]
MNRPAPRTHTLVDERQALDVYLEALLREVPELAEEAPPPPAPAPAAPVVDAPAPANAVAAAPAPQEVAPPPEWGRQRFQAMLFRTAGLMLAVPLVELSGVQEWEASPVTPLPRHVDWFLGLVRYRGRSVPVVDTALLVLPQERRARLTTSAAERSTRIVFIGEGDWGLACDSVAEVITLEPDQVRWRTTRTSRSWLAGTVIQHMCALIDPAAFARLLAAGASEAGLEWSEEGMGDLS